MPWAYYGPWGQPTQDPVPNKKIASHLENENKQRNVFISKNNDHMACTILEKANEYIAFAASMNGFRI